MVTAVNTFGANGLVSRDNMVTHVVFYYTFDERGNVAQRLDGSASVLSTDFYDAFGVRTSTYALNNPWGFGAQWGYYTDTDNETGLVLCTHRFYDPAQGRFVTRDPAGYGCGVNLYSYTQNNPVNGSDPSGYQSSLNTPAGAAEIAQAEPEELATLGRTSGRANLDPESTIYRDGAMRPKDLTPRPPRLDHPNLPNHPGDPNGLSFRPQPGKNLSCYAKVRDLTKAGFNVLKDGPNHISVSLDNMEGWIGNQEHEAIQVLQDILQKL